MKIYNLFSKDTKSKGKKRKVQEKNRFIAQQRDTTFRNSEAVSMWREKMGAWKLYVVDWDYSIN